MFGSATLEIALGMIFIFLLLSVICSTINEWIASILNLRGKTLRSGIRRLLDDPEGKLLARHFYDHPLVQGMASKTGQGGLPSYIPAETFTTVLMDILVPADLDNPKPLREVYQDIKVQLKDMTAENTEFGRMVMILMDETGLTREQLQELKDGWDQVHKLREDLKNLETADSALLDISAIKELSAVITEKEAKLVLAEQAADRAILQARKKVGDYFDNAMDRVSGWYKRQASIGIFGLALVVTIFLNVDSISLANALANNPALREAVVASAENGADSLRDTVGAITESSESGDAAEVIDELEQLGLPIGWNPSTMPQNVPELLNRILGWLVTTIAVSMGAPFWFDLLSKVSNLRMAGKKPDRMGELPQPQIVVQAPAALPQPVVTVRNSG